ncbi:hypothetical protein [Streptomyces sp. NPDC005423]|uniref:hypothetical protein n=1 Tax=Streptomyces sp. NPDC005423 TaxID=3155343 RepID=UPI0033B0CE72
MRFNVVLAPVPRAADAYHRTHGAIETIYERTALEVGRPSLARVQGRAEQG